MKTLYIGETNKEDTAYYYTLDKSACNLYIKNFETALAEKTLGIFYTSLKDFNFEIELIFKICLFFDNIIYRPPPKWKESTINFINSSDARINRYWTECLLLSLSTVKDIKGLENIFDLGTFYPVVTRQTDLPNLWIAGCSFSSAIGVEKNERWGQIVAEQLNMPVNFLAEGGSGNSYQVNKILSSDIRKDDIVIMQVTTPERSTIIYQEKLHHITAGSYESLHPDIVKYYPPDRLDEPISYVTQIEDFKRLKNICKKIGAKLMVWSQHTMPGVLLSQLISQDYYFHFINAKYTPSTKFMLDIGTDNEHPGPLQHQAYAKFVLEKLKLLEEQ